MENPAGPFEIDPNLLDPLCNRDIEGGKHCLANHAVSLKGVPLLEGFDSSAQLLVKQMGHAPQAGQFPRDE